ncbi:MAG: exodeoxyribonuclease III [Alphaproteobacteria bacterium]|nr:exodeoxyribonuclease III [Alphaproteobacteria bacterium]MDE1985335.1 exodeoxyribonuclease III [Alphaproteobacteria bacterium]MDE2162038.1 exodeoxyribonuclease III [Alphaproteobacteria bacterium]MDE2265388.1 exodeoxyribonuclease III [Alphaproteobacteria bacterium]MDE2500278.1 exodeoxyribonuclease III [Alphaproteobacteria bacterium]
MKIATWNVNSVKARLDAAVQWLKEASPDIVCLQEIKCTDDTFPAATFEDLGYNCAVHGQKTYNGVAILSKRPLEDVTPRLPGGKDDDHARYLEAVATGDKGVIRIASIYAPNGNPIGTEKFAYKLAWLERLHDRARALLTFEEPVVLMGDYNVIPMPEDCYDPAAWSQDALFQPESRAALRKIENLGYADAFRACNAQPNRYTFWDYQAGAWQKDHGIRIDHILLSPQALDRLKVCAIDKRVRGREKPSDHVPVWCEVEV